jgi:hypothetical protein
VDGAAVDAAHAGKFGLRDQVTGSGFHD